MPNEKPEWEGKGYSFFQNRECEFFPCHKTACEEDFSCLFCYCPLYALGDQCGGGFVYTESGFKDCSACTFPHRRENYGRVLEKYPLISDLAKRRETKEKE